VTDEGAGSSAEQGRPSGSPASGRRPRGWASVYAVAFLLMLAATVTLIVAVKGFLASTTPLWVSAGLSAGSIVASAVSVVLPRR
jgi:hypothetical protein